MVAYKTFLERFSSVTVLFCKYFVVGTAFYQNFQLQAACTLWIQSASSSFFQSLRSVVVHMLLWIVAPHLLVEERDVSLRPPAIVRSDRHWFSVQYVSHCWNMLEPRDSILFWCLSMTFPVTYSLFRTSCYAPTPKNFIRFCKTWSRYLKLGIIFGAVT